MLRGISDIVNLAADQVESWLGQKDLGACIFEDEQLLLLAEMEYAIKSDPSLVPQLTALVLDSLDDNPQLAKELGQALAIWLGDATGAKEDNLGLVLKHWMTECFDRELRRSSWLGHVSPIKPVSSSSATAAPTAVSSSGAAGGSGNGEEKEKRSDRMIMPFRSDHVECLLVTNFLKTVTHCTGVLTLWLTPVLLSLDSDVGNVILDSGSSSSNSSSSSSSRSHSVSGYSDYRELTTDLDAGRSQTHIQSSSSFPAPSSPTSHSPAIAAAAVAAGPRSRSSSLSEAEDTRMKSLYPEDRHISSDAATRYMSAMLFEKMNQTLSEIPYSITVVFTCSRMLIRKAATTAATSPPISRVASPSNIRDRSGSGGLLSASAGTPLPTIPSGSIDISRVGEKEEGEGKVVDSSVPGADADVDAVEVADEEVKSLEPDLAAVLVSENPTPLDDSTTPPVTPAASSSSANKLSPSRLTAVEATESRPVQTTASSSNSGDLSLYFTCCSSLLFLRMIVPALLSPSAWGVLRCWFTPASLHYGRTIFRGKPMITSPKSGSWKSGDSMSDEPVCTNAGVSDTFAASTGSGGVGGEKTSPAKVVTPGKKSAGQRLSSLGNKLYRGIFKSKPVETKPLPSADEGRPSINFDESSVDTRALFLGITGSRPSAAAMIIIAHLVTKSISQNKGWVDAWDEDDGVNLSSRDSMASLDDEPTFSYDERDGGSRGRSTALPPTLSDVQRLSLLLAEAIPLDTAQQLVASFNDLSYSKVDPKEEQRFSSPPVRRGLLAVAKAIQKVANVSCYSTQKMPGVGQSDASHSDSDSARDVSGSGKPAQSPEDQACANIVRLFYNGIGASASSQY